MKTINTRPREEQQRGGCEHGVPGGYSSAEFGSRGTPRDLPLLENISYLDAAHCFLRLHHTDVFGRVTLGEQLRGAQVIGGEDDAINEVLGFARPWN